VWSSSFSSSRKIGLEFDAPAITSTGCLQRIYGAFAVADDQSNAAVAAAGMKV